MTKNEFIALIGQDIVVDYSFWRELQRWSMKNFYIDENGEVKHNRLPLIEDVAAMMALLKIARASVNPEHVDSWIDGAGYMACGGEISTKEENT